MRYLIWLAGAWLALMACSLLPPATPAPSAVATLVAATLQPPATAVPTAPATATPATPPPPRAAHLLEGNACLWEPGRAPRPLTTTGDATALRFSPDGRLLAVVRALGETAQEIWVLDLDGGDFRPLVNAEALARLPRPQGTDGLGIYTLAWVPGTHILAYTTHALFAGPGLVTSDDLQMVNADTLAQRTFLAPGEGGRFTFSPDGQRVAISSASQVDLLWLDGRAPRQRVLTYEPVLTYSEYQYQVAPQWAPDGSYLLVLVPPADPLAKPTPPSRVWRLPTDGTPATPLAEIPAAAFWFAQPNLPLFDPTLTHLAYLSQEGDLWSLHIATPQGDEEASTAPATEVSFLGWAPSAERFVYALEEGPPQIQSPGGEPQPLTPPEIREVRSVAWVTEDTFLLSRGEWDNWEVYAGTLGSETHLVVSATAGPPPQIEVLP